MTNATIVSVRTGRVREVPRPEWDRAAGSTWRTAYFKDEAPGPVRVVALGLEGDEQANRDVHGGLHMAVLAYAAAHYALWRAEQGLDAIGPGGFGENLTLQGIDESQVCIGDVWEGDHVAFEVSQPRGPCAAISRVWDSRKLMQAAIDTGRVGWYLRVAREGTIARGESLRLAARTYPQWTIQRVFRLRIGPALDPAGVRELAGLPALSSEWRGHFARHAHELDAGA